MSTSHAPQPDIPQPDAKQITEFLLLGFRPERVAKKLGIPVADALAAKKVLDEAQSPDADEAARRLLFRSLRLVREEALEAWEVSKEQGEHHAGDPRYLDRITRAVDVEARLRALDKRFSAAKGGAANKAGQPAPSGPSPAKAKLIRAEMAMHATFDELMRDWKLSQPILERLQKHLLRIVKEGVPIDEKTEVESLLDLIKRHLAMSPANAPPSAASAPPEASPASALPIATSAVVKSEISDLRFQISENIPANTVAVVNQPGDDEEDQDEDAYLIERYGPDAPELMKPTPPAPTPAPRTLPGPAPATGGPPRREQIRDTS